MDKLDIAVNALYIQEVFDTVAATRLRHTRLLSVNGRHCDGFVYVISGGCTYRFDDGYTFTAQGGDILYLAEKSVYTMQARSDEYVCIFCNFRFGGETLRRSEIYHTKMPAETEALFRRLKRAHDHGAAAFAEYLSVLYAIYGVVRTPPKRHPAERSAKGAVALAREYMDTHFGDSTLSISALADKAGMSEVHFRKVFRSLYGISPSQHLIATRLKRARELMAYPLLTLADCALQSGFSSLQYFCRVFKKHFDITPAKYRESRN